MKITVYSHIENKGCLMYFSKW